jgi:sulfatase modifying factor 1
MFGMLLMVRMRVVEVSRIARLGIAVVLVSPGCGGRTPGPGSVNVDGSGEDLDAASSTDALARADTGEAEPVDSTDGEPMSDASGTGPTDEGSASAAESGSDAGGDAMGASELESGARSDAMMTVESEKDSGPPPSCLAVGLGRSGCGANEESCCVALEVPGGTYDRTYTAAEPDGGAPDPATISGFSLDKYDVTVGRFRQFVGAVVAGWMPAPGSGKHVSLNDGQGLVQVNVPADAGAVYEPGWNTEWDTFLGTTSDEWNMNLASDNCSILGAAATWTDSTGMNEDLPINCLNWYEAYAFCIWDGGFLPSEAEWEYAAAGGSQQRAYPWGSTEPGTASQYAIYNCYYPSGTGMCDGLPNIAPVGTATLGAGLWGQLDLDGNVRQWILDGYAPYSSECTDCANLICSSCVDFVPDQRVNRGGGFDSAAPHVSDRGATSPLMGYADLGVRCARTP